MAATTFSNRIISFPDYIYLSEFWAGNNASTFPFCRRQRAFAHLKTGVLACYIKLMEDTKQTKTQANNF